MSGVIVAVTKEPVSHCALLVCDTLVIHSTVGGVQIDHISRFLEHSVIIYEVPIAISDKEALAVLDKYAQYRYDIPAMLWIGMSLMARRVLPGLVSKRNLMEVSGMFICTELLTAALGEVDSMITPFQLYLRLVRAQL
jgi:hypothetical protein